MSIRAAIKHEQEESEAKVEIKKKLKRKIEKHKGKENVALTGKNR